MKDQLKWELYEDGYYRKHRLVQMPSGLIVGGVSGTNHNSEGWYAYTDGKNGPARIGTFVTETLAKNAVAGAAER